MLRTIFSTNHRTLVLEGAFNIIVLLEDTATTLGGVPDENNQHNFHFDFDTEIESEKVLLTLEELWYEMKNDKHFQ